MKILKTIFIFIFASLIIGEVSADSNLTKRMKARLPDVMEAKSKRFYRRKCGWSFADPGQKSKFQSRKISTS